MNYILYKDSGEIIGNYSGMHPEIQEGMYVEGEVETLDDKYYISDIHNPIITNKQASPIKISSISLAVDDLTYLTDIPPGSIINISGEGVNIREDLLTTKEDISFDLPGEYTVSIAAFPYLEYKVTINVT
jgi:hypothetical protein